MNWKDAVEAMTHGYSVYRKSLRKHVWTGGILDTGVESIRLAAAWTVTDRPALVYQGASSKELHVPSTEEEQATDWTVDA